MTPDDARPLYSAVEDIPMMETLDVAAYEDAYAGSPPVWDIGHAQPALRDVAVSGAVTGHVLDLGCGTGEHALLAASMGLTATGLDLSATAIAAARDKAARRGLAARFVVGDAFDLPALDEQYDTVLDCGLLHNFAADDRRRLTDGLAGVVRAGGCCHLLCFSDAVPAGNGPARLSATEVRESFATTVWHVDVLEASTIAVRAAVAVPAWFASVTRR